MFQTTARTRQTGPKSRRYLSCTHGATTQIDRESTVEKGTITLQANLLCPKYMNSRTPDIKIILINLSYRAPINRRGKEKVEEKQRTVKDTKNIKPDDSVTDVLVESSRNIVHTVQTSLNYQNQIFIRILGHYRYPTTPEKH